jgi:hypothetical protein
MSPMRLPDFLRLDDRPATRVIESTSIEDVRAFETWLDEPAACGCPKWKRPRARFSLRWWVVVIALGGIVLGMAARLIHPQETFNARGERFLALASWHKRQIVGRGWMMVKGPPRRCISFWEDRRTRTPQQEEQLERKNKWHEELAEKYRRAAKNPSQNVEADPPEPN